MFLWALSVLLLLANADAILDGDQTINGDVRFRSAADTRSRYDPIDYPGCGQRPLLFNNGVDELDRSNSKIFGGSESVPYTWPAICSLRRTIAPYIHICGGNLVRNLQGQWYLITAAHCLHDDYKPEDFEAHCGIHDRSLQDQHHKVKVYFTDTFVPQNYSEYSRDLDIAIFKIMVDPTASAYIQPVCITNEGWNTGEMSIVAGWGIQEEAGPTAYRLHQVTKPIKDFSTCTHIYGHDSLTEHMLCAGVPEGDLNSCEGDSGGPLYTYRFGRWTLTGVVSWGVGCGRPGYPGVYTDIDTVKQWIHSVINPPSNNNIAHPRQ